MGREEGGPGAAIVRGDGALVGVEGLPFHVLVRVGGVEDVIVWRKVLRPHYGRPTGGGWRGDGLQGWDVERGFRDGVHGR